MRRMLLAIILAGIRLPALGQSDETLSQKIDRLIAAVDVEENPKAQFAGEGFLDLPPEAAPLLQKAFQRKDLRWTARACIAKGLRKIDERAKGLDWAVEQEARRQEFKRIVVDEYMRVSAHEEAWDTIALQTARGAAAFWGNLYRRRQEDGLAAGRDAETALKKGCEDPLIVYIYARMHMDPKQLPMPAQTEAHERASKLLDASKYHPLLKSRGHKTSAEAILRETADAPLDEDKKRIAEHLKVAVELLVTALESDAALHPWTILEASKELWALRGKIGDPKVAFDPIYAALVKTQPNSGLADLVAGSFLVDHAWQARGGGWAQDVTPEGWKLFGERLGKARVHLEAAWKAHPGDVQGPQRMLSVTLGDGRGREEMELWFRRGVESFPDDYSMYSSKLYYLEPKWHGSPEEMLQFGRQCALTGNWDANVPWILLDAHRAIACYGKEGWKSEPDYKYFDNAAVWADVKALYDHELKRKPDQPAYRATYAFYAGHAKQWKEADAQFQLLGDTPAALGIFRTLDKYRAAKEQAARMAKATNF
jgi:hypothetical protein